MALGLLYEVEEKDSNKGRVGLEIVVEKVESNGLIND